jgi:hypothetical protein
VAIALAHAYPRMRFVVQDAAETLATGRGVLRMQPASARGRIETPSPTSSEARYTKGISHSVLEQLGIDLKINIRQLGERTTGILRSV